MNRRVILHTVGRIIQLEAILLLLPLVVSCCYREWNSALSFLITTALAAAVGFALTLTNQRGDRRIFARGGLVSVALSWVALSVIGCLPFVIKGMPFVDALFETVSGLTTTGASILPDPAILDHGLLFWRSFTHWIGGMGVIVLMMAILPAESGRSIHIMRAEMPGPIIGKLVPRLRDTAKTLYLIYIAMTVLHIILLACGDMTLFESMLHSFGSAGTGGFGIVSTSIGGYSSYSQWVIAIFMLLFGVNFNIYQLMVMRRARIALKSSELWCYIVIVAVAVGIITVNILPMFSDTSTALRQAVFQVSSVITTTGYSTTDFNMWPSLSKTVLLLLMFTGACAGSTAGGLKLSRVMLLFKSVKRDMKRIVHPRAVSTIQLEGKTVDEQTVAGVGAYFVLYIMCIALVFLILSFETFDFETNFSAAVACFNNIGPGFGGVGAASSYAAYSDPSKIVLTLAMLFGRLEIYPLLVVFSPSTWGRKR